MSKIFATAALAFALLLAACVPSDPAAPADTNTSTDTSVITANTVVIDVRTPAEYANGHLDGAINIDYQSASFSDEVAELDKSGSYVLYCRTGIRAGEALKIMESLGFTDVTNAKSYNDASKSTGLAIVK